jgi:alanyl aminopeptidase
VAYDRDGARGQTCGELTAASAELTLPATACPAWVFANAGGRGYYRISQPEAALVALRDRGWKLLTPAERLIAFGDVSAFAATGELDIGLLLSLVPRMLAEHNAVAAVAAVDAAQWARELLGDDQLARFDAWTRRTFGATAHALGWQPGGRDDIDSQRSRAAVVPLVAWSGDAALRAAAVGLARGDWRKLGSGMRDAILEVAGDADPATFDRMLAAAPAETDPELRGDLLRALSRVTREAQLRSALALALDPRIELRELFPLVVAGRDRAQIRIVDGFFRDHVAELIARFPTGSERGAIALSGAFLRRCDPAQRDDAAAFVRDHFGKLLGAERAIARGLERLDQCIAAHAQLGPRLAAWLARLPH